MGGGGGEGARGVKEEERAREGRRVVRDNDQALEFVMSEISAGNVKYTPRDNPAEIMVVEGFRA